MQIFIYFFCQFDGSQLSAKLTGDIVATYALVWKRRESLR